MITLDNRPDIAPTTGVVRTFTGDESGTVVWHRGRLRTTDQPAVARAADDDRVFGVFAFASVFYEGWVKMLKRLCAAG